jgi:hypothetical protein
MIKGMIADYLISWCCGAGTARSRIISAEPEPQPDVAPAPTTPGLIHNIKSEEIRRKKKLQLPIPSVNLIFFNWLCIK